MTFSTYLRSKTVASTLFAVLAMATPASAEDEVATILELVEPVCRNIAQPVAMRHQALENLGWQMAPESAPIEVLALSQMAIDLATRVSSFDEQEDNIEIVKTRITKPLAESLDSEKLVARWFANTANPNLGLMFAHFSVQGYQWSECHFVVAAPDDKTLSALTNFFPLARVRVTALARYYGNADTLTTDGGQTMMINQLVLLEAPSTAAIFSVFLTQTGSP